MIAVPADSKSIETSDPPLKGNGVSEEKGDGNPTGTIEEGPKKIKEDGDGTYTSWATLALRANAEL